MAEPATIVKVRREPGDYRIASYPLDAVENPHWDRVSGGVQAPAPRDLLYGYVMCNEMIAGEVAHSGLHAGPCPHNIKVCILKKDNEPTVYAQLAEEAGPKPKPPPSCREDALNIVRERQPILGPDLRRELHWKGHGRLTISRVLPQMVRGGELRATRRGRVQEYTLPDYRA
jgi:hypothetical protein